MKTKKIIVLDLETRSRVDLSEAGAYRYSEDPSTHVLCAVMKANWKPDVKLWIPGDPVPDWVMAKVWETHGVVIEAHNRFFEACMWQNVLSKRHGWPALPDAKYWACTAARAAMQALPRSLDKVGEALDLPVKKDMAGKMVMLQLAQPRLMRSPPATPFREGEPPLVTSARNSYEKMLAAAQKEAALDIPNVLDREYEIDPDGTVVQWYTPKGEQARFEKDEIRRLKQDEKIKKQQQKLMENPPAEGEEIVLLKPVEVEPNKYLTLYQYCKDDVLAEECLSERIDDLPASEREIWELDQQINFRGVYIDLPNVEKAIGIVEDYATTLTAEIADLTRGFLDSPNQVAKLMTWLGANGVALGNVQAGTIDALLANTKSHVPDHVRRVLEIRRSLGKASIKKLYAMRARTSADFRSRDIMKYHGTSTGRPTGAGLQVLNLPKPAWPDFSNDEAFELLQAQSWKVLKDRYGDPMEAVSSMIRGFISAPPGYDLVVADYASIEARVVAWLADQEDALEVFRTGGDIYVEMASSIYKKPGSDITKAERNLGKVAILGLGYGMGAAKFQETCAGYDIEIDEEFAAKVVRIYREKYPKIKGHWYETEDAMKEVVLTKRPVTCGFVTWAMHGNALTAILPSGRRLYYQNPSYQDAETSWGEMKKAIHFWAPNPVSKRWQLESTYGARTVENISQAVARDLMYAGALKAQAAGYDVTNFIYDELVSEVRDDFGSVEDYCEILCDLPPWGCDIPVKAEGYRSKRYKK